MAESGKPLKFTRLELPLRYGSPFCGCIYARPYASRGDDGLPNNRTLLIANIPNDDIEQLEKTWKGFAEMESVRLLQRHAALRDAPTRSSLGLAVFRTSKGCKAALEATRLPTVRQGGSQKVDIQTLIKRFRARIPTASSLQAAVDQNMALFEQSEADAERERKQAANQPDEEGFIRVAHGRKGRKADAAEAGRSRNRKRKRASAELKHFYVHQMKESKRQQLLDLRQRFDADRARIEKLKASRKFRPFG